MYERLRIIVKGFIVRDGNFKKSPTHPFQLGFLLESRKTTAANKIEGLKKAKTLKQAWKTKEQLDGVNAKVNLIHILTERIFTFIRARIAKNQNQPVSITEFPYFLDYLLRSGMANFEYKEAKHLPELKEAKENTAIRDFLAAIRAYHDILSETGKGQLISFVINAKILGSAKTKLGDGDGINTLEGLKTLLHERSKETYESIREKLANVQLKSRTLEAMANEISEIAERLAAIEIQRQGAESAEPIRKMIMRDALLTFKKKIPERLKLVVEAAQPESIEDALKVASAALAGADQEEVKLFWGKRGLIGPHK